MVAAMDAVGVDAAILVSVFTMYQFDPSYALEVYAKYPKRFRVIKPVDPSDPTVVDTIDAWAATKGTVAIRIMLNRGVSEDAADPGINRVLAAAARHALPVNLLCWGRLEQAKALAARNPNTRLVIDHLGLQQPFAPPTLPNPFGELSTVLSLAQHDNVVIKISGACTLSQQKFPYQDIWDPLARIFDAYGFERCMWGTDWTRAVELLTYQQGVDAFTLTDRLSDAERTQLMGGSLQKIYNWNFAA
jgi:predicted TIM-barrel fold metal-dependent hydrolase